MSGLMENGTGEGAYMYTGMDIGQRHELIITMFPAPGKEEVMVITGEEEAGRNIEHAKGKHGKSITKLSSLYTTLFQKRKANVH